MRVEVFLNQIETAVPETDGHARFIEFLPQMIEGERELKLVQRLAAKCQIEHRYSVLTPARGPEQSRAQLDGEGFFAPGHFASTARRMERYRAEALPLACGPVARILARVEKESITHLIVTSCTGFYAPGLDLELQRKFALRPDLERTIIGFMGCYAAISGLKAAKHIVRSAPESKVLLVNLEICSLHLQDDGEPESVLGAMQFADGCAASLISAEPVGLRLERFRAETFPAGEDKIRWNVGDTGFEMYLAPDLPKALGDFLPGLLARTMRGEERAQMKNWAIHPGGRSILDAVQARFELTDSEMKPSRDILREFGNMSSATIMFVLSRILVDPGAAGLGSAFAFGPGLTVESMIFSKDSPSVHA